MYFFIPILVIFGIENFLNISQWNLDAIRWKIIIENAIVNNRKILLLNDITYIYYDEKIFWTSDSIYIYILLLKIISEILPDRYLSI